MNDHFIKNIEIKNFKCFENFKAEGFSRVNLITGKNNVGKTALMEALGVNAYAQDLKTFVNALISEKLMRETLNLNGIARIIDSMPTSILKKYLERHSDICITTNIQKIFFKVLEDSGAKEYLFEFQKDIVKVNSNIFNFELALVENIEFIDNFGLSNLAIIFNFSYIQKLDKESFLNDTLNNFDQNIKSFKIIDEKPQCKINNQYLELTEFGDGARHLVSIITSLFRCENGYLFIDEMDNGIHYSKLDDLWEVILKTSKELNVQIFVTTHSRECIESYARVAKKLADEEVTLIELGKVDNKIDSIVFNYTGILHHIKQRLEVRGW